MKNSKISVITLAMGLTFSVGAMAEGMSKEQYKSFEKNIEAEYKVSKAGCDSLSGNANDICVAEAKGKQSVAKADLEASYKPSVKARYKAAIAKADADYSVAIEKCDDKGGNDKDVCVKEAKAEKVHGMADAKAQMKTAEAGIVAHEKSVDANATASEKSVDARNDAAVDKRDADYTVAKEKCDVLAGEAKDRCISDAKASFSQH